MTPQPGIVNKNTLWENSTAGFSIGALLQGLGGFAKLSANNLRFYVSHPNPAADYAKAVRRVESKIASEVDFYGGSHSFRLTHGAKTAKVIIFAHGFPNSPAPFKEFAAQFYERGYNVLITPLPYNGLADPMTTEHAKLLEEDLIRYTEEVVDIGRGLGDHLTLTGISGGGLVTGWAVQQRRDLDKAVLISPGFGFAEVLERLTPLFARAFIRLQNSYISNRTLDTDLRKV